MFLEDKLIKDCLPLEFLTQLSLQFINYRNAAVKYWLQLWAPPPGLMSCGFNILTELRESFPGQVDRKSRGPQGQRGLQMEEIACKCQTFLSLLSDRRKQINNIFFLLYTNLKGGFS